MFGYAHNQESRSCVMAYLSGRCNNNHNRVPQLEAPGPSTNNYTPRSAHKCNKVFIPKQQKTKITQDEDLHEQ